MPDQIGNQLLEDRLALNKPGDERLRALYKEDALELLEFSLTRDLEKEMLYTIGCIPFVEYVGRQGELVEVHLLKNDKASKGQIGVVCQYILKAKPFKPILPSP